MLQFCIASCGIVFGVGSQLNVHHFIFLYSCVVCGLGLWIVVNIQVRSVYRVLFGSTLVELPDGRYRMILKLRIPFG